MVLKRTARLWYIASFEKIGHSIYSENELLSLALFIDCFECTLAKRSLFNFLIGCYELGSGPCFGINNFGKQKNVGKYRNLSIDYSFSQSLKVFQGSD